MTVLLYPSWTQAPHWIVYLSGFIATLLGLLCIAASQNWKNLRNILVFALASLFGVLFAWFAIGFGPRECLAGSTLNHGLTCRIPAGFGALLWFTLAWGAFAGKIQD